MKIIELNPQIPEKHKIKQIREVLENDGLVVYPTDTIYGLGANIFSEAAIKKVYSLKKRDLDKPLSVCLSMVADIEKIAYIDQGKEIIEQILPGPFTIILKKKEHISQLLTAGSDKIGIRIPDNNICREITREFPITSTSANLSGDTVPKSVDEVIKKLGDSVDLIIDGGLTEGIPSTVIDWTISPPKVLRKGVKELKNLNLLV
jgi:L-threonylcarbamoyladenylate synthase